MSLLPFSTSFSLPTCIFYSCHTLKREKLPSAKNKGVFPPCAFWTISISLFFPSVTNILKKRDRGRERALFLFCALLILIFSQSITNWLLLKELLLRTPTSLLLNPKVFSVLLVRKSLIHSTRFSVPLIGFSLASREPFPSGFPPTSDDSFCFFYRGPYFTLLTLKRLS